MRKALLAAAVCAAALTLSPNAEAQRLSTRPDGDSAILIPTHVTTAGLLQPIQYFHHRRHWHHRHWRHYHH